jgi:hypothetical protein
MSKTVTLAEVMNALEGMGVTGDPRTIAEVRIEPHQVTVMRKHQSGGKDWLDENGHLVMTREDIRITRRFGPPHEDPPPCPTCKGTGAVQVEGRGERPCPDCCHAAEVAA